VPAEAVAQNPAACREFGGAYQPGYSSQSSDAISGHWAGLLDDVFTCSVRSEFVCDAAADNVS
jgi:hypothetical protein